MTAWKIEGDYMETCNCNLLCPCISSNMTAQSTEKDCKAALAMKINRGEKDRTRLDGLSFIVLLHSPGPMIEGNIVLRHPGQLRAGCGALHACAGDQA